VDVRGTTWWWWCDRKEIRISIVSGYGDGSDKSMLYK
jgi:hypothetical protein